jgi:hypothetical protein
MAEKSDGDVPVGTAFEFKGLRYKPVDPVDPDTCIGCAFDDKNCLGSTLKCMAYLRHDEKNVIFIKVKM